MNLEELGELIRSNADTVHIDEPGQWHFDYFGRVLIVLTSEAANRMRVITPVAEVAELDTDSVVQCLAANFDRALDARYAINGEYLWSAFIHPLEELQESQLVDALTQVATLAVTYGTTFNSSGLLFGAHEDDLDDDEDSDDEDVL